MSEAGTTEENFVCEDSKKEALLSKGDAEEGPSDKREVRGKTD